MSILLASCEKLLRVDAAVFEGMVRHARREYPLECCGVLLGAGESVREAVLCRNELKSPFEFRIAPEDLLGVIRRVRSADTSLLGFYHSHPRGPSRPSQRDFNEYLYRDVSYWIISLGSANPRVRCFDWTPSGFVEGFFQIVRTELPQAGMME